MADGNPKILVDDLVFAEGPRWHQGRLWFSDMYAHEVIAVNMEGKKERMATIDQQPSGIGFLPDGLAVVVSMLDRRLMRLDPDGPSVLADLSNLATGDCNDMVTDSKGRSYVGHLGFDVHHGAEYQSATLILVTADGKASVVARDLAIPNGAVISADGKTLVVAESRGPRLTAFDIADDGSLSNRKVWAQMDVVPDGICLDAENCVWVASPTPGNQGGFLRIREGGEIVERIDPDGFRAIACVHGGPDRKTLFLIEALTGRPAEIKGPGNARIRVVETEIPGAGIP